MRSDFLQRREFLQAGLGCAALAAAPAVLRAADSAAKPRIPLGFLGATYSHGPEKIKLAMNSLDWEFVGVCDASDAGRKTCAALGAKLVTQEELFRRAAVVAVESDVRDHAPCWR